MHTKSYLHHEPTSYCVKGVRADASSCSDCLRYCPLSDDVCVLLILEDNSLGCVMHVSIIQRLMTALGADAKMFALPCTETPKPWYRAMGPPRAVVFFRQSIRPVNSLSAPPLPTSAASLVLAKSRGYTISRDPAPAKPPAAMLTAKNLQKSVLGLYLGNKFLMVSCKPEMFETY